MKILHLITSLKIGGAENFLVYLLKQLRNNKDEHVVIYFYHGPNVSKINEIGIPTFKVSGLFGLYDILFYFRLKKMIQKIGPDIIHSSLWSANILGRIISKKLKIPIICDIHNDIRFNGAIRNFLEKKTASIVSNFIAVSDLVAKSYQNIILNGEKNNVDVITNGIDFGGIREMSFDRPLNRSDFGFDENDFVIGAIGRLEPIKSFDFLIRSFAQLLRIRKSANYSLSRSISMSRRVKLCIVGGGSQMQKLVRLSEDLKIISNIIFVGERDDAYKFYPLFDCLAISSKTEGISIALLEALCFGLPVVSTHDVGPHAVIVDGKNGFLITDRNIDMFANKLNLLCDDIISSNRIRNDNINLVKKRFDINVVALKYQKMYNEVIKYCQ